MPSNTLLSKIVSQQATIIANQSQMMMNIIDIKQSIRELQNNRKIDKIVESAKPVIKSTPKAPFELITSEEDLNDFEEKLQNDENFKNAALIYLLSSVGNQKYKCKSGQDCAYLFDPLIFASEFWALTAWTGGRQRRNQQMPQNAEEDDEGEDGTNFVLKKKFEFAKHFIFRNFLSTLVYNVIEIVISTDEIRKYVQNKSKNALYERRTSRVSSTRMRIEKKE